MDRRPEKVKPFICHLPMHGYGPSVVERKGVLLNFGSELTTSPVGKANASIRGQVADLKAQIHRSRIRLTGMRFVWDGEAHCAIELNCGTVACL